MKAIHPIKTWLNRFRKSSGMGRFCRLVATTADAFRIEHLVPVPANPQLVVEFAPAVQFNPPLNFQRPSLDSLRIPACASGFNS
jgi:hypothetical protein